ncbi:MAG: radical SAM protein [Candidatus Aminicenantes bacterium]|nr:radical SAM protein [Candidatus Aminicenantes bacterium]
MNETETNKILLALLPYWTPLIPPQGIAQMKVFLEKDGYKVKTVDANVETEFKEIYQLYFNTLKKFIPGSHWGNFYNIGHDVLRNHMMAHFNHANGVGAEETYKELVKLLVYHTYFWNLDEEQLCRLDAVIDRFYSELERYILRLLEEEKPAVLGLTAHLGTLGASMFAFKLTKEKYPGIMTVVGGSMFAGELPMSSPDFGVFLEKTPYIDKVIVGEGEQLFLKLLRGEIPASQRVITLKEISGRRMDIATLELPDLSGFDLSRYPFNAAFISKSCPYQCRFCSVVAFFGEFREKNVSQAVDQLTELYKRHDVQVFHMLDSLANPFMTALAAELIDRDLSFYMDFYMRVSDEVCDPEITYLWRRGGLYRARLGIETGSPRLLEAMDKGITVEQSKAAIRSLAGAGIKTTTYFVVGFPGETEEDFQQTLDFIEELKNDIWQMECNPFYYYYAGQPEGDKWANYRMLLYPGYARDLLISQTWILNCEPSREERFKRMFRLVEHCKKLGIPNPYSTEEMYEADERWKNLHENAVPSIIEFQDRGVYIDENKHVKRLIPAREIPQEDGDFVF